MSNHLEKIVLFLKQHHVLSLATSDGVELSVCNLFYSFNEKDVVFIVASNQDTLHMQHIAKKNEVAGTVVLETKSVGKIQGVQFQGDFVALADNDRLREHYFLDFSYSKVLKPSLYKIVIKSFKMTDNRLGFGKKIIWKR